MKVGNLVRLKVSQNEGLFGVRRQNMNKFQEHYGTTPAKEGLFLK